MRFCINNDPLAAEFPLNGVIGVIANSAREIAIAKHHQLQCVEMRPDLLLDKGLSVAEIMSMVGAVVDHDLRCLFTLRRHDHGGKFHGTDKEQMDLSMQAVAAGAHVIDVEWDSKCAEQIIDHGVPTILSHHDFSGLATKSELAMITDQITTLNPAAIKIIPTANNFDEAVQILIWLAEATRPRRIGFAMGAMGEFSRIMARGFGSPITYAAFDAPVAPGQIPLPLLLDRYQAQSMGLATGYVGVMGDGETIGPWLDDLNRRSAFANTQTIAVPIQVESFASILSHAAFLRMDKIIVSDELSHLLPASITKLENSLCSHGGQSTYLLH